MVNTPLVPRSVLKDILDKNVDLADVSAITRFEFCNLNFEDSDVFNHLIESTPI
jgi:hypothetical protein